MNKQRMYTIGLMLLLLGVTLTTYGVWTQSSFSHGIPTNDAGCWCHNDGIAVFVNGTGDGGAGVFFGQIVIGSTFHLLISTANHAAGVVPGLQMWESNQTDNAQFTFNPAEVTATSPQNLSPISGNITALYKITAPTTPGDYVLTLYSQGTRLMGIAIQVVSTTTSITSTTTSSHIITQIATSTDTKLSSPIPGWEYDVLVVIVLFLGLFVGLPLSLALWWSKDSKHQEPAAKDSK